MRLRKQLNSRLAVIAVLILTALPAMAHPPKGPDTQPWQAPTSWPDRILVSPGETPQTGFTVTWRTDATVSSAIAEIVQASADSRFDVGAVAHSAKFEHVSPSQSNFAVSHSASPNFGLEDAHYHSVRFKGLEPDTLYAYRVRGERGRWSEWFQTRTAPERGQLTFLYYGDAQYGILSHAARLFRQGMLSAPDARFILHAGDLVNKGDRDVEWGEWHEASGFIHAMIPVVPVAGNHEYLETQAGGSKDGKAKLTDLWRPQFTLPVVSSLPAELHETVYDLRFSNDLHVFVLDSSSPHWRAQMDWLRETASTSDATWKVVGVHHSPFRPGIQGYVNAPERGAYHRLRQDEFLQAASAAGIDLVLAGHNHSYTRASYGSAVGPGLPSENAAHTLSEDRVVEMVVMVSIVGAMSGGMTAEKFAQNETRFGNSLALERWANNTPTYQVVRVDQEKLSVDTHLATGDLYDQFLLTKDERGQTTLSNGAISAGPIRRFETTGPYKDKSDLR